MAINHGKRSNRHIYDWPRAAAARHADDVKVRTTIVYDSTGCRTNWQCTVCVAEESLRWVKILLDSDRRYFDRVREVQEVRTMLQALGRRTVEEEFYRQSCLWMDMATVSDRPDYAPFGFRERRYIVQAQLACSLSANIKVGKQSIGSP